MLYSGTGVVTKNKIDLFVLNFSQDRLWDEKGNNQNSIHAVYVWKTTQTHLHMTRITAQLCSRMGERGCTWPGEGEREGDRLPLSFPVTSSGTLRSCLLGCELRTQSKPGCALPGWVSLSRPCLASSPQGEPDFGVYHSHTHLCNTEKEMDTQTGPTLL